MRCIVQPQTKCCYNETQSVSNTNTAPCKGKPKCYTVGWKIFDEMKIFTAFAIELMPRSEIIIATLCVCPRGQCLQKFNLRIVLLIIVMVHPQIS